MKCAILQIAWGPLGGRKTVIAPGEVLRVGRGEEADLVLAHDRELGSLHFEIDWDGKSCQVRSRQGTTLLGGRPVDQADVPHGGWLRAGSTTFTVHFENHTPPAKAPKTDPAELARRRLLIAALAAETSLWGIFDAARDARVLELLGEARDPARSLYEGAKGDALASVAPHLVRFEAGSRLLEALVLEGWGEAWGIYFTWNATEKDVRRHLRRLLMVEDETTRERMYFRFYDPRALRVFLPTCSVRQLHALFGELDAFFLEGETGELLRFARSDLRALAEVDP